MPGHHFRIIKKLPTRQAFTGQAGGPAAEDFLVVPPGKRARYNDDCRPSR
jgi:hypothetical protein